MTVTLPKEKTYSYIIALIGFVITVFVVYSVLTIFRDKHIYLNASRTKSMAQAQLLGENTSSVIYSVDLTLLSILSQIEFQNKHNGTIPEKLAESIKKQIVFLPQIQNIVLFNSAKKRIFSLKPHPVFDSIAFEEHRDALLAFSINTAVLSKQDKLILISRRVENAAGEFSGVLVAAIDPVFFYGRYEDYLNIDVDGVALLDAQQNALVTWYHHLDLQLRDGNTDFLDFLSGLPAQALNGGGLKTHEDAKSIVSTYQLPNFPFQIAVLHLKGSVLQQWHQKTKLDIGIIAATVLIGIATMLLATTQRKKRHKAEGALVEHQNHLEELIAERTANLKKSNDNLVAEIDVRQRTEIRLRESEQRYRQIYCSISDSLFITDLKGFIMDVNPAACDTYGYSQEDLIGRHSTELIHKDYHSTYEQFADRLRAKENYCTATTDVRKDGTFLNTEIKGTLFILKGEQHFLVIIRDVTERRQNEIQREKLISELQEALDEIKTLKGILPICSYCKKIRDDQGYWRQLESYIQHHSDAQFSHSICRECAEKHFPDIDFSDS